MVLLWLGVLAFLAGLVGWLVAAGAAIGVFLMAPPGSRWAVYHRLGLWRHHEIAGLLGEPARGWLRYMRRGALVFFAGTLVGVCLMLLSNAHLA
jgi:hypothetical protein